jgi:hypothetical protein
VDLQIFLRVVWRFRLFVALGVLLATTLALFSFVRIDLSDGTPSVSYRGSELWESNARLLVTPPGFKWGATTPGIDGGEIEGRLPTLTALYSSFVTSDQVRAIMLREGGPIRGVIYASPLPANPNGDGTLPIVNITADSFTVLESIKIANRAAEALRTYVTDQQEAAGIPQRQRIELRPMNSGFAPRLIAPRSKTMPIVIFLAVMFATMSLVFVLENLRPRPAEDARIVTIAKDRAQHSA